MKKQSKKLNIYRRRTVFYQNMTSDPPRIQIAKEGASFDGNYIPKSKIARAAICEKAILIRSLQSE